MGCVTPLLKISGLVTQLSCQHKAVREKLRNYATLSLLYFPSYKMGIIISHLSGVTCSLIDIYHIPWYCQIKSIKLSLHILSK